MEQYDVLVVGAGLAGLTVSRRLSAAGHRVCLADAKSDLSESIHTTGIFVRRTLEDFADELPDDCLGPAVRHVKLYSPSRRTIDLESPFDEFRVGRMGLLYKRNLDAAVAAGVEWRSATRFVGASGGCEKGVNDASSKRPLIARLESGGKTIEVASRFLVGADGANSRVARALELSENREFLVGLEAVYERSHAERPCLHCFLDPRVAPGYIAWVSHDGVESHVGVAGYAERFDVRRGFETFHDEMRRRFDLPSDHWVETRGGRIPVGGVLPRIANGRGLLVGDAAGAVSPLTAGGLDPCLRQAELAAEVIRSSLAGEAGAIDVSAYHAARLRRRFRIRRLLRFGLASIRTTRQAEWAVAAMRYPPLRQLAQHIFYCRGSFPLERHELPAAVDTTT